MENFNANFVILQHNVVVRNIGNRYLLIKTDYDYSKRNLIPLTEFGVQLVEFIKTQRSISEVFQYFNVHLNQQKSYLDYFHFLSKEGYITLWDREPEGKSLISTIVRTDWKPSHTPFGASIELTPRCNFKCIHCYLGDVRTEKEEMTTVQIKKIIDILFDSGMLALTFTGGEPLLRQDFKEIYCYARKKGMLIEIFSNGYLFDQEILELFLEYPPLEIDISLYGSNDEIYKEITGVSDAFTKVKNNVINLKKSGITVSLKSPVMINLADDLASMVSVAKELDVDFRFRFSMLPTISEKSKKGIEVNAKKAVELYAAYSKTYRHDIDIVRKTKADTSLHIGRTRYACGLGKCSCFIDYLGKVYPCIETRPMGIGSSIFDEDFKVIWERIGKFSYVKLNDVDQRDYKCLTCEKVQICPSCPAIRERNYGSPLIVKDVDCEYTNELYDYILKNELDT